MPTKKIEGLRSEGTLHMDHKLVVHKPIPVEGTLKIEKVISAVYDRGEGKGAKINVDIIARDESGEPVFTNTMGYLNRWSGGFGGPKAPHSTVVIPDREPDCSATDAYPANAPLLYRLTGDTFPLHADPEFAKKSGFDRPIVHGLCSLGYACRLITRLMFPGEPERMISIENQFRSVAMPGDQFTLNVWKTAPGEAVFRMVKDSDGKAILDYGCIKWKE
jgi:acyl dehydratase